MKTTFTYDGHKVVIEEDQQDGYLAFGTTIDGERICQNLSAEEDARRAAIMWLRAHKR